MNGLYTCAYPLTLRPALSRGISLRSRRVNGLAGCPNGTTYLQRATCRFVFGRLINVNFINVLSCVKE